MRARSRPLRVDADVHPPLPPIAELIPRLPPRWREFARTSRFVSSPAYGNAYPKGARTTTREGSAPLEGGAAAGLERLRDEVLDADRLDIAILNCYYGLENLRHPDWAGALARAVNEWLAEEWLAKDDRLRASIAVDPKYPALAAAEVDRAAASHPGFVQVLVPVRSDRPYGNREFDPLLEAVRRNDLVLGIHFGGFTGSATTSVGWPTYYFEEYVGMAAVFMVQILSLIAEGAFERHPGLRVALIEGGWTWLPPALWRMDKEWRGLRRETPWVTEAPSAYVRRSMRATLQPIDAPPDEEIITQTVEQTGSDDLLLYSSDYPHESGTRSPAYLDLFAPQLRDRIMGANAAAFYSLRIPPQAAVQW